MNLTDGLDGLVAGSGSLVFGAYVLVAFWHALAMLFVTQSNDWRESGNNGEAGEHE